MENKTMTDAITRREDGFAEMAFVGATPWWGGGQRANSEMSMDEWAKLAGMEWSILSSPVQFEGPDGKMLKMDDRRVHYRDDNLFPLGVASMDYKVVQPKQILGHMEGLADKAGFKMNTAGTLFGGKQFWGLAELGAEAHIRDERDRVTAYLLLATSADGSLATVGKFVNTRVVCWNTLTMALREKTGQVKFSHKKAFDSEFINKELGIRAKEEFEAEIEKLRTLADTAMAAAEMARATLEVYNPGALELKEAELLKVVRGKQTKKIMTLALGSDLIGGELEGSRNTAWGWLNSVTQYIDHDNGSKTLDRRFQRALFGRGETYKTSAEKLAFQFATDGLKPLALSNENLLSLIVD
jgi:phage/plasmid-like protein (TIGR03299 family)